MTFYDEMREISQSLLQEFKQGETFLVRKVPGDGPSYAPGVTETRIALDATVRGVKFRYVARSLAVASDMQLTHSPIAVEPAMTDFVEADGVLYKIVHIDRKPSAGVAVAFTLVIRK